MSVTMSTWLALAPLVYRDLVVLGPTCTDDGCREVARWTTHWPGQTSVKCTRHRDGWTRIAQTLGFELVNMPLAVNEHPADDASALRFSLMELS